MSIRDIVARVILDPKKSIQLFLQYTAVGRLVKDQTAITILYYFKFGYKPNLKEPKTFNEKILWLTLHNRKDEYTTLVDKYAMKQVVEKKLFDAAIHDQDCYTVPTIAVYKSADDISLDCLPDEFVVKTTHDSGGVVVVPNKQAFDISTVKKHLSKRLKQNYYWFSREWPYRNVEPQIIVEKYIRGKEKQNGLSDYKIMCFNGNPKIIYVVTERRLTHPYLDFFDCEWNRLPIHQRYENSTEQLQRPEKLGLMLKISKIISRDIPFVRVDFYEDENDMVYIGELTLTPSSGLIGFEPEVWDRKFGDMLDLSRK